MPAGALPLLAALTPAGHTVTLVDENVEPIDFDLVQRADLVGVTGMNVQRFRMREIATELKRRGLFAAVGGPWVTVQEDYFAGLADVIFVGEAEEAWPRFLDEWQAGRHRRRYITFSIRPSRRQCTGRRPFACNRRPGHWGLYSASCGLLRR
jgi:radical SAM superfamily enzyme YgiQ (UPF0313 family)